jgi:four helix bundle protein
MVSSYRDLKVWQAGMQLAQSTYRLLERFPPRTGWGLQQQLERSAISIPSNVAEGHARDSTKEYLHYLSYSLGSVAELETQVMLASRMRFVAEQEADELLAQADEVGKMLRGVQKTLKARA